MADHCHYCTREVFKVGSAPDPRAIKTKEHKIPKSLGKGAVLIACWECNNIKNNTPYEVFAAYLAEHLHRYQTHSITGNQQHYQQYCFDLMLAGLKGKTK
jgi:hypothetical protein